MCSEAKKINEKRKARKKNNKNKTEEREANRKQKTEKRKKKKEKITNASKLASLFSGIVTKTSVTNVVHLRKNDVGMLHHHPWPPSAADERKERVRSWAPIAT